MNGIDPPSTALFRRLLFALTAVGAAGLIAELFLAEHTETAWQWTPLVLLIAVLPAALLAWLRPSRAVLRLLRLLAVAMLLAGAVGVYLHYTGNAEFEREGDPTLAGWPLFRDAIQGATPALAPGAMAQLALIALIALFRHPVLSRGRRL